MDTQEFLHRMTEVNVMKTGRLLLALGVCLAVISILHARTASAQQTPADGIAAQIRAQGYRCDVPVSAQRNAQESKPDEAVWVLKCQNATYRIRLIPDMAAKVESIE